ncbi:hypothetical protein GCM10027072_61840 [Streptomyces bullii]
MSCDAVDEGDRSRLGVPAAARPRPGTAEEEPPRSGSGCPGCPRACCAERVTFGFVTGLAGKAMSMTEQNKSTNQKPTSARATESKARRTAERATAPAARASKTAAAKAGDGVSAAKGGAERSAELASGAMQTAAKGVEAGRQAIVTASGQVAATAKTAWTVIAERKLVAAGVGAGLTALSAASYAVGRRAERQAYGPLTRLTGGRI